MLCLFLVKILNTIGINYQLIIDQDMSKHFSYHIRLDNSRLQNILLYRTNIKRKMMNLEKIYCILLNLINLEQQIFIILKMIKHLLKISKTVFHVKQNYIIF